MCSLTDQLGFLGREKHVGVVRVNSGSEVLIAVGHGGASRPKLPPVDVEGLNIRAGGGGRNFPGNIAVVRACVVSKPVEGAGIVGSLGSRRVESKAKGEGFLFRLAAEKAPGNAHVGTVGAPAGSQTKQTRDLAGVHVRRLVGCKDWEML